MKKKPLPKEYFIEALLHIANMGKSQDYDGYNPDSADAMRTLVDSMARSAEDALEGKPLYSGTRHGADVPLWEPQLVTKDWKKIYPKE